MTSRTTPLGAPGPRPLGTDAKGSRAAAGATSMTLGTLREVRSELANLGELMDRMSKDMSGLRRAVEAVAAGRAEGSRSDPEAGKAAKRVASADAARDEREAALTARVEKLERRVAKLRRRLDWRS